MAIFLTISLPREAVNAFKEPTTTPDGTQPASLSIPVPPRVQLEVHYLEEILLADATKERVPRTERTEQTGEGKVELTLGSVVDNVLTIAILNGDGSESSSRQVRVANDKAEYTITADDVKQLLASRAVPPEAAVIMVPRSAQLVPIGAVKPDFVKSRLSVVAVTDVAQLNAGGVLSAFGFSPSRTSTVEVSAQLVEGLSAVAWTSVHIGVDGRFIATFQQAASTIGWVWWLSGARQIVGFVTDDLSKPNSKPIVIALPALQPGTSADSEKDDTCNDRGNGVSADVTEAEVVNNPGIYSEDPGAFCKPFSNPERVLSEKSFSVVTRIQQPDIGAMGSTKTRTQHLLDLDPTPAFSIEGATAGTAFRVMAAPSREVLMNAFLNTRAPKRYKEPADRVEETKQMPSGRTLMNAEHPMQWEDDVAQYQAATVALGHILEFRVRSRSNGYSLGHVASTLTLAPRQTKRIQKIAFERVEKARREERTQLDDSVNDEVTRERDYNDTVAANLSEWATGSSSSGMAAAAAGIGFAIGPVVVGGGGGASKAWSESEQQGSRSTTAREQQRLQDSIRRHGDALRRFESTVVSEVSQQETVTGTTEIVRNPNYGHSLTVIYYQILRHLKVSTEFAGARECLFVPFAIKPFTLQRAYRWREAIQKYIRSSKFGKAMKHLRDVATNFQFSNLQPGTRAQQHLTYLRGSVFIMVAVERPGDKDDGKYDAGKWQALSPFLGSPSYGIWAMLAAKAEALRDQLFQKDHAPTIAAKWANKLVIKAGGADLQADCTMATRYGFNQTVRVDFTVPASRIQSLTRAHLATMRVVAGASLPPGSVANVSRMSLRYGTANFERTIEGLSGVGDVIEPGTGVADDGAQLDFPLDAWDHVDERQQLMHSVNELIEHLNEHVVYYHKAIMWSADRDHLLMMLDGFYVPGTNKVSIASVVDREPLAIIGNSLVYRVGAASFIGYDKVNTPNALYNLYAGKEPVFDPILISLPTDGLYAQTIMDECLALEEHQGSVDWVLNDPDPELGTIDPSLMTSRRADVSSTLTPTNIPGTIINLQNAPDAPTPTGLQGVLNAVTNPNAFRDMAGLAGTQANARAALESATNLATQFATRAVELKKAEMAATIANEKMAVIEKAHGKQAIDDAERTRQTSRVLAEMTENPSKPLSVGEISGLIGDANKNKVKVDFASNLGEKLGVDAKDITLADFNYPLTIHAVIPTKLEWASGIDTETIPFIAQQFREEYNLRLDQTIFEGPTAIIAGPVGIIMGASPMVVQEAKLRTRDSRVSFIVNELNSEGGRAEIARAVLIVNASVALQVAKELKPRLSAGTGGSTVNEFAVPISVNYISQQLGMVLAWLDEAIRKVTADEAERIDLLKRQWDSTALKLGILTELLPIKSMAVGTGVGILSELLLNMLSPDYDREFSNYQSILRVFRNSFDNIAKESLKALLLEAIPTESHFTNPMVPMFVANHGAYVLRGWDEEKRFLGA